MAKKKNKNKEKQKIKVKRSALHADTKRSIVAIICFVLSAISLLSIFGLSGVLGNYLLKNTKLLFGQGFFLVPLIFLLAGLALLTPYILKIKWLKKRDHIYTFTFLGVGLLILSLLGLFHILGSFNGAENQLGGYLGLVFGWSLMKTVDFWASLIILLALSVIAILITFNISLKREKLDELKEEIEKEGKEKSLPELRSIVNQKMSLWKKFKNMTSLKEKIAEPVINNIQLEADSDKKNSFEEKSSNYLSQKIEERFLAKEKSSKETAKPVLSSSVKLPSFDILESEKGQPTSGDIDANKNIIKRSLENFGIEVEMGEVNVGPTVTQYTLRPAHGVKLSKITSLSNDLALALAAHPIRIEAPIPGRSLVGIEIPNKSAMMVRLRNLLDNPNFKNSSNLNLALGRDVSGKPVYADLAKMPHLLIAGSTGTGKTIGINCLIASLLYQNSWETLRMIMIDPKRVEFTAYNHIPHLLTPVIVQNSKAVTALRWAISEMERRFETLQGKGARDISSYNSRSEEKLPYIVIVIDELADIMATCGREVEAAIVRLAQMARAIGIHLIIATQRPSVEVITGLIKANITTRIGFQVASQIDSRTILDMAGSEKLLGNGDLLFLSAESSKPKRVQGTYISEQEVKGLADYWRQLKEPAYEEDVSEVPTSVITDRGRGEEAGDTLYEQAKEVVIRDKKASASLLQRRLKVGYARAARILDILEDKGIVGPADGAKPRSVYPEAGGSGTIDSMINEELTQEEEEEYRF